MSNTTFLILALSTKPKYDQHKVVMTTNSEVIAKTAVKNLNQAAQLRFGFAATEYSYTSVVNFDGSLRLIQCIDKYIRVAIPFSAITEGIHGIEDIFICPSLLCKSPEGATTPEISRIVWRTKLNHGYLVFSLPITAVKTSVFLAIMAKYNKVIQQFRNGHCCNIKDLLLMIKEQSKEVPYQTDLGDGDISTFASEKSKRAYMKLYPNQFKVK